MRSPCPMPPLCGDGYVLVRQDSPSAVNADDSMSAPEGYVYVKVKTGVSDDNYTQVTSGLSESDTIAYDPSSVSSDSYYDDGGYDDMDGEVIGGAGNNADLAEGGEETLPEETEKAVKPPQRTLKSPQRASTPPRPAQSWWIDAGGMNERSDRV